MHSITEFPFTQFLLESSIILIGTKSKYLFVLKAYPPIKASLYI